MCIGSSNDDIGENETKSNIACAHLSESKTKWRKKIENIKKQIVKECNISSDFIHVLTITFLFSTLTHNFFSKDAPSNTLPHLC